MEIKVTSCEDCPFAEYDYDGSLLVWCEHFGHGGNVFDVSKSFDEKNNPHILPTQTIINHR